MGMVENMSDIIEVLKNDEELLRLLYYEPQDFYRNIPDPLDPSLPNILDKPVNELKEIREKRFVFVPKATDLVEEPICRLYIYAGVRKPVTNYHFANQEIVIDVLCHFHFEKDLRSMRISDRLNELLIRNRVTGLGKIDYVDGRPINTVENYVQYQNVYRYGVNRK